MRLHTKFRRRDAARRRTLLPLLAILLTGLGAATACGVAPRPPWTTSKIQGTPNPPPPYRIQLAFPNLKFEKPTSLEELPDGRMLVSEIGGRLYTFSRSSARTDSRTDSRTDRQIERKDLLLTIPESSVWHATAHPRFASNGLLFVCYSKGGTTHVSRFAVSGEPPRADPDSETVLLTWPAGGHNAGCLQFGVDGMLYISTGDGSGPNPPDGRTAAQDISNLFGCILRIDVDRQDGGQSYAIPPDNPFVDRDGARGEIWAYGLRNPWKFGVDRQSGRILAADNGWESWEMVHEIVAGGNCGWPIMEGRAVLRGDVQRGPTPIRPPVKDHSHTEANSVIGGPIYRGSKLPKLDGTFIYGDYITGTIWGLKAEREEEGEASYTHQTLVDTDQRITAFAQTRRGELLVLDYDYTGQIYELAPSGLEDRSASFPRRLSETGLFESVAELKPAAGVMPYEVNVPRWMDGAIADQRWVAIPGDGSITLADADNPARYPEGTVFVKHLTHRRQWNGAPIPIETQILHYENGVWHPYTYAWSSPLREDTPLDATLVDARGAESQIDLAPASESGRAVAEEWHFSAENECRLCHNAGSGFVLGFVANQLDRLALRPASDAPSSDKPESDKPASQLSRLSEERTLARRPAIPERNAGRLVDPFDPQQSLDDRARSYLHANCSCCHHPGGNAIVSFHLRRDLPFEQLRTNKGTGIGTFGIRDAQIVVPGDPYRSILLYRMAKLGYGRMPYIGSRKVDSRGVTLIEAWIRGLPHAESDEDSALVRADSREARALEQLRQSRSGEKTPIDREPLRLLFESTEGALAVALAMHGASIDSVSEDAYRKTRSDIGGLFEDFVPTALRRKTFGRNGDPQTILALEGSADRGRLIFFSDGARCRDCHHVDDAARSTGPTLSEIRKKYKRRSEMLQHILQPSLKVDEPFAMWVVATHSGAVHSGLLLHNTDDEVALRTVERQVIRIPKSEIDTMRKSARSLMPEGILSDLTAQEAADLIRWLGPDGA